jgi:hypothetical protein
VAGPAARDGLTKPVRNRMNTKNRCPALFRPTSN